MQQHAIFFSFEGRGDAGKESQRNEALGAASLKISHFPSSSGALGLCWWTFEILVIIGYLNFNQIL